MTHFSLSYMNYLIDWYFKRKYWNEQSQSWYDNFGQEQNEISHWVYCCKAQCVLENNAQRFLSSWTKRTSFNGNHCVCVVVDEKHEFFKTPQTTNTNFGTVFCNWAIWCFDSKKGKFYIIKMLMNVFFRFSLLLVFKVHQAISRKSDQSNQKRS